MQLVAAAVNKHVEKSYGASVCLFGFIPLAIYLTHLISHLGSPWFLAVSSLNTEIVES